MPSTSSIKKPFAVAAASGAGKGQQQRPSILTSISTPSRASGGVPESPLSFNINYEAAVFGVGESPLKPPQHHLTNNNHGTTTTTYSSRASGGGAPGAHLDGGDEYHFGNVTDARASDQRNDGTAASSGSPSGVSGGGYGLSSSSPGNSMGNYNTTATASNNRIGGDDDDDEPVHVDDTLQKLLNDLEGGGDDSDDGNQQTPTGAVTNGGYTAYPAAPPRNNAISKRAAKQQQQQQQATQRSSGGGVNNNANNKAVSRPQHHQTVSRVSPFLAPHQPPHHNALLDVDSNRKNHLVNKDVPTCSGGSGLGNDQHPSANSPSPAGGAAKGLPSYITAVAHTSPQTTAAKSSTAVPQFDGLGPSSHKGSPAINFTAPPHLPPCEKIDTGFLEQQHQDYTETFSAAVERCGGVGNDQNGGGGASATVAGSSIRPGVVNGEYLLVRNLNGVFLLRPTGPSSENLQHHLATGGGGALNGSPIPTNASSSTPAVGGGGASNASRSPVQAATNPSMSTSPAMHPSDAPSGLYTSTLGGGRSSGASAQLPPPGASPASTATTSASGVVGKVSAGMLGASVPNSPTPSISLPDYTSAVLHHHDHHHPLPPPSYPGGPLQFIPRSSMSTPPLGAAPSSGVRGVSGSRASGSKQAGTTPIQHHSLPVHNSLSALPPHNRSFSSAPSGNSFSSALPPPPAYDGTSPLNSATHHHHHNHHPISRHSNPPSLGASLTALGQPLIHRGVAAALPPPAYTISNTRGGVSPSGGRVTAGTSPMLTGVPSPQPQHHHPQGGMSPLVGSSSTSSPVPGMASCTAGPATMALPPPAYPTNSHSTPAILGTAASATAGNSSPPHGASSSPSGPPPYFP